MLFRSGDFVIPRSIVDDAGVTHEYHDEVLGEAWEGGPVLLSWFDGNDAPAGINVVIHEFAHKLDMGNGEVDGYPALPADMPPAAWAAAFKPAYDDFCRRVDDGEDTALDRQDDPPITQPLQATMTGASRSQSWLDGTSAPSGTRHTAPATVG